MWNWFKAFFNPVAKTQQISREEVLAKAEMLRVMSTNLTQDDINPNFTMADAERWRIKLGMPPFQRTSPKTEDNSNEEVKIGGHVFRPQKHFITIEDWNNPPSIDGFHIESLSPIVAIDDENELCIRVEARYKSDDPLAKKHGWFHASIVKLKKLNFFDVALSNSGLPQSSKSCSCERRT